MTIVMFQKFHKDILNETNKKVIQKIKIKHMYNHFLKKIHSLLPMDFWN
jgi:hypothetical protein